LRVDLFALEAKNHLQEQEQLNVYTIGFKNKLQLGSWKDSNFELVILIYHM
jgi:hypothetical protein